MNRFQIGNDVVDVLGADGQTDGVLQICCSASSSSFSWLWVVEAGDDRSLHVSDALASREHLQVINKLEGLFTAALMLKVKTEQAPPLGSTSHRAWSGDPAERGG